MLKSYTNEGLLRRLSPTRLQRSPMNDGLPRQQSLPRRLGKHPALMHYNRLIALVMAVNLVYLGWATQGRWLPGDLALGTLFNLIVVNISMAILIRQQVVINLLFKAATSAPTSWPLSVRRVLGKVYHFGGLHVGGALVGTIWFAAFSASLLVHYWQGQPGVSLATVVVTVSILLILLLLLGFATPKYRAKYHDAFERTHRFGGWAALLLFWI